MTTATIELRGESGSARVEPMTGRVRCTITGTLDDDTVARLIAALADRLGSDAALEIVASRQEGANPTLRERLHALLARPTLARVSVRVVVDSAQVELSYRGLGRALPGRVEVVSASAAASPSPPARSVTATNRSASVPSACPPPVRSDTRRWPVLVITPPGEIADHEMEAFLSWYRDKIVARGEPFGLVLDLRTTTGMSPRQRRMITDGMDAPGGCRALGMVFDSVVLRGVLTAIFWMRKPAYPTRVFADVESAAVFVGERLATSADAR